MLVLDYISYFVFILVLIKYCIHTCFNSAIIWKHLTQPNSHPLYWVTSHNGVGLPIIDDDDKTGNERQILTDSPLPGKCGSEKLGIQSNIMGQKESLPEDLLESIL